MINDRVALRHHPELLTDASVLANKLEEDAFPCQRLGFSIADARLSSAKPETLELRNTLTCGDDGYLCGSCVEVAYDLIENQNRRDLDFTAVDMLSDDESDDEDDRNTKSNKERDRTLATKVAMGTFGATVAALTCYGAYHYLSKKEEVPLIEKNIDSTDANQKENKTIIANLDQKSVLQAVQTLSKNTTDEVETLLHFSSKECQHKLMDDILGAEHNTTAYWSSDKLNSTIVSLDKSKFTKALGLSVINNTCLEEMSVETLPFIQQQKEISALATKAELLAKLNAKKNTDEVCVSIGEGVKTFNMDGKSLKINEVECKPKVRHFTMPSKKLLDSPIGRAAQATCISRLGLISDGISTDSSVNVAVTSRIQFDNETLSVSSPRIPSIAEQYAQSALRRCPTLKIDDCKASASTGSHLVKPLSSHKVIKCLDYFLNQPVENKPDRIVVMEPTELANYHPSIELVEKGISELKQKGIEVHSHDSSPGAWLSDVENLIQTSEIDESMTKPPSNVEPVIIALSTLSVLAGATLIGGAAGYCLYNKKQKKYQKQQFEVVNEYEMHPLNSNEGHNKDNISENELSDEQQLESELMPQPQDAGSELRNRRSLHDQGMNIREALRVVYTPDVNEARAQRRDPLHKTSQDSLYRNQYKQAKSILFKRDL